MKKLINRPDRYVDEAPGGLRAAFPACIAAIANGTDLLCARKITRAARMPACAGTQQFTASTQPVWPSLLASPENEAALDGKRS